MQANKNGGNINRIITGVDMMQRKFIFKDSSMELQLPVTPPSFTVEHGINIETINIHTIGDVNIAGYSTLATLKIECLFPAQSYSFALASQEPYSYVEVFKKWCSERVVVRFIVSDTPVNLPVLVQSITYSEQDGTNDVYATITLREYRELRAVKVEKTGSGNKSRPSEGSKSIPASYTIKKGDTLSSICRKFYGDASLYPKLAAANGIKNPNLIYAGRTIKLPSKSQL
jgi:phage tail protein X